MAKLALTPNPTFKAKVLIPVPGDRPAPVEFTFRHRNREDLASWLEKLEGKPFHEAVTEMASAWDLEDPFDGENVKRLLSAYIGAFSAIYEKYLGELAPAREKN